MQSQKVCESLCKCRTRGRNTFKWLSWRGFSFAGRSPFDGALVHQGACCPTHDCIRSPESDDKSRPGRAVRSGAIYESGTQSLSLSLERRSEDVPGAPNTGIQKRIAPESPGGDPHAIRPAEPAERPGWGTPWPEKTLPPSTPRPLCRPHPRSRSNTSGPCREPRRFPR